MIGIASLAVSMLERSLAESNLWPFMQWIDNAQGSKEFIFFLLPILNSDHREQFVSMLWCIFFFLAKLVPHFISNYGFGPPII